MLDPNPTFCQERATEFSCQIFIEHSLCMRYTAVLILQRLFSMLVTTPPFTGSSSQCEAGSCGKRLGAVEEGRLGEKKALFSKSLGDISITEVILNGRTCL